ASSTTPPTPTPTTTFVAAPRLSTTAKGDSDEEETRQEEEESFDPIPKTPEGSAGESNDEDDQELRLSEEARIQEEEEADELYHSHVTLTPVHHDGPQESSSVSSFMTSMLNPISDAGVESKPTPIMTPSTIATIKTSSDAPIPPTTIPSIILENLPTFNSAFRFDERLKSLKTTFSEYRQTNLFVDAVSAIPVEKKDDEKKRDMSRVKGYNCKKEGHFAKDCKKVKVKDYEYHKTKMLLAKKDKDEQVLLTEDQAWMNQAVIRTRR
nr:hypothetical protein [Tanacetum cinerariifolium]